MKTAAFFTALAMLAGGSDISRADDYLSGYLDIGYTYQGVRTYFQGEQDSTQSRNIGTLAGAIQYRLDDCAVGANISGSHSNVEYRFASGSSNEVSWSNAAIGAQAGCRVQKLWIVGLAGTDALGKPVRTDSFGLGLYYIFNDQYRLGFSAEQQFGTAFDDKWMKYTAQAKYFLDDNLVLSASLNYQPSGDYEFYGLFSKVEYKFDDRPVSVYAGLGADYLKADDVAYSFRTLTATAGLRFFFNDGSLKTISNNSMPDFRN